jgi:hypothetical protein
MPLVAHRVQPPSPWSDLELVMSLLPRPWQLHALGIVHRDLKRERAGADDGVP